MQPLFTYNQEQAASVGAGQYVTKSGGYELKVTRAEVTRSQSAGSQAQFMEFDFETKEGLKCNYVSICFVKGDGTSLDFGNNLIQAIMGCAGVQNLTVAQDGKCYEIIGKTLKAVLQRVDYTKNSGEDGYKFELKLPALMSGQTIQEQMKGEQAKAFASYAESISDKDERTSNKQQTGCGAPQNAQSYQQPAQGQQPQYNQPPAGFDDSIPF